MKIDWIFPGQLAASGIPIGLKDLASLVEQGVGAIVTLTEHPLTVQRGIDAQVLTRLDLENLHIPIRDQYPPDEHQVRSFGAYLEKMKEWRRAVLVHCHAGVGRTGTILHAHLIEQGWSLEETKRLIRSTRLASQFLMLSEQQRLYLERLSVGATNG